MTITAPRLTKAQPRPPRPWIAAVERNYCFLLNAQDIAPGAAPPRINLTLDFNLWTWNSRAFPGITPWWRAWAGAAASASAT
jgi:hypothetical protein